MSSPRVEDPPGVQARHCGDTGLLLEVNSNTEVHPLAQGLRDMALPGVLEVVPAMRTVLVVIDPRRTDLETVAREVDSVTAIPDSTQEVRDVMIPVEYSGEDLTFVAQHTGLGVRGVIQAHTESVWHVGFCGFAPGFAYLIGGDARLEVPRRGESRLRVPPGAVALAGRFASVYPRESPGGWQLIGHTGASLWDTQADPPAVLTPGVRVQFYEVSRR